MTLQTTVLAHAADYGIKNPELLFPDATNLDPEPQRIMRENSWVSKVLQGAKHSPFSRVKTQWSNLTADDLRAKGYVKASRKKDVVYEVANRKTEPTTVYNKMKIDRDDVLDITTFNVVAWMQQNLRLASGGAAQADRGEMRSPNGKSRGRSPLLLVRRGLRRFGKSER